MRLQTPNFICIVMYYHPSIICNTPITHSRTNPPYHPKHLHGWLCAAISSKPNSIQSAFLAYHEVTVSTISCQKLVSPFVRMSNVPTLTAPGSNADKCLSFARYKKTSPIIRLLVSACEGHICLPIGEIRD